LGIALFVSVLTGTAPAVARREGLITTLKEGSTQSTLGSSRGQLRSALIVAQVSVSFLLLIGAGLMVRSLINLKRVDPGFRPENVLTVQLNLDFARYTANEKVLSFVESLLDKVQAVPGVTSVATAGTFPLDKSPSSNNEFVIEGEHRAGSDKRIAEVNIISPGYLDVLGIPLLSGRNFDRRDRPDSPHVALITQALAQHYWNNADPIGRRLSFDDGKTWTQIIGVIGDVHEHGLDQPAAEFIHLPFAQYPTNGPALMARTQSDPMAIARTAVQRLYEVDPNQPAGRIQSLEQYRADSIAAPRLTANLLGLFALLALAIAAAGIGGVMALAVSQRTHEIGVRMAIGARPGEIVRMILNQGMGLVLVGVAVGLAGAFALTNAVKSFLFQVTPNDPATFVGVAAVLAVSALAACYIPARRAARVDPLRALRTE
jgi:putative ABC transport system permease protein